MKRLLIVVDYQNDFIDGSLGFPSAEAIAARIAEKIKAYRAEGDPVIFTLDTHESNYLETQEGRYLPVEHCLIGTPGHDLYPSIEALRDDEDVVIRKPSFGSTALFSWLKDANDIATELAAIPFSSIELVGLVSNICVISNAVIAKTACPEVPVIVDAACTAGADAHLHEAALDVMAGLQIEVINR